MAEEKKEEKMAESVIGSVALDGTTETTETSATSETDAEQTKKSQKDQESNKTSKAETKSTEPEEKPAEPAKPADPDWKDLYARLRADFDNYKKRTARDREDTYHYAEADILKDILPTVDNLALALANSDAGKAEKADEGKEGKDQASSFVKGVQLVYDALLKSLKDHGAEPFDSVGKELDTEKMEAIATLPSPDIDEGKVSNEVKRGWMLKGKVLRVAQVVVSSGKPA